MRSKRRRRRVATTTTTTTSTTTNRNVLSLRWWFRLAVVVTAITMIRYDDRIWNVYMNMTVNLDSSSWSSSLSSIGFLSSSNNNSMDETSFLLLVLRPPTNTTVTTTTNSSNSNYNMIINNNNQKDMETIQLLLPKERIDWMIRRNEQPEIFESWFVKNDNDTENGTSSSSSPSYEQLRENIDTIDQPIIDFLMVGFPKCGSSTVSANLARYIAPMSSGTDVCTPPPQTIYYSYKNWPRLEEENNNNNNNDEIVIVVAATTTTNTIATTTDNTNTRSNLAVGSTPTEQQQHQQHFQLVSTSKIFRGSKCPAFISESWPYLYHKHFQHTKLIIGIRHPVLWYQSFWNMGLASSPTDPYSSESIDMCYSTVDHTGKRTKIRRNRRAPPSPFCQRECSGRKTLYCVARSRFHLPLARLGKTSLSIDERQWLAPNDPDGGHTVQSMNITNPIFLYEQTQLKQQHTWDEMGQYLGLSHIPNTQYQSSKGKALQHDICLPMYDNFRATMMPYSYELSIWLLSYLVPVAKDPSRSDVTIAHLPSFRQVVTTYQDDPCHRLIRLESNGTYVLNPSLQQGDEE